MLTSHFNYMALLSLRQMQKSTGGRIVSGDSETLAKGFSIDSRTIKKDEFFIALKGRNFDGHDFIKEAAAKGAGGVILEKSRQKDFHGKGLCVIAVENTLEAIKCLAKSVRDMFNIPAVCVTGTNGKTTVKEIMAEMLSAKFKVLKSIKSYNNAIGLSLTLFNLDESHDIMVLELGSNHPGEIASLARIASGEIAIITNIGSAHLEFFNDIKGVFCEKTSLLGFLRPGGMAILNGDDDFLAKTPPKTAEVRFFGRRPGCDYLIDGMTRRNEGYDFFINGKSFHAPLRGEHNVYNAAACVAAGAHLGLGHDEMRDAIKGFTALDMRLERIELNGLTFINDSYNSNPDSFMAALKVLEEDFRGKTRGVLAADMMELGSSSGGLHRMIGKNIADKRIDFLITLGHEAEHIAEGALEAGMDKEDVICVNTYEDAARALRKKMSPGAAVLLKGSRMAKVEEVLECFTTSCIR